MENSIQEVLGNSPLLQSILKEQEASKTLSSDVSVLTSEEIIDGLNMMAEKKVAAIKLKEYYEKISQAEKIIHISKDQYRAHVVELLKEYTRIVDGKEVKYDWLPLYERVLGYFAGEENCGLDLNKGILAAGTTGSGKTEMMKLFSINPNCPFKIVNSREVARTFMTGGADTLVQFRFLIKNLHKGRNPLFGNGDWFGICFDDLGTEPAGKNYGNNMNVMAEILQDRYDLKNHRYTHVTTNLSLKGLKEVYGDRVFSRMAEMFNVIDLAGAKDMRLKSPN